MVWFNPRPYLNHLSRKENRWLKSLGVQRNQKLVVDISDSDSHTCFCAQNKPPILILEFEFG